MKYFIIPLTLLISFVSLNAQTDQDKQALRNLKSIYEEAIKKDDLSLLKEHLSDDFSAIMITGEEVKNFDELQGFWKQAKDYMGENSTYTVVVNADDSIFIENIAIAKGTSEDTVDADGSTLKFTTAWTAICRKLPDGTWKLTRLQVTTHPVDNPFAKLVGKMRLWITALGTGFVALLIGLIAGKRMGYKKAQRVSS